MRFGLLLGTNGAPAFTPAELNLTSWVREYPGTLPWDGIASAGSSGGGAHDWTTGTAPSAGAVLNGHDIASFNGTTQSAAAETSADAYLSTSAYTIVLLVKPTAPGVTSGTDINDPPLIGDTAGNFGITYTTSGVKLVQYDGAYKVTGGASITADVYSMVAATFNGSTLSIAVNQGTAQTASSGNLATPNLITLQMGKNYSTARPTMLMAEVMTAQSVLSSSSLNNIKTYFNTRYALSL